MVNDGMDNGMDDHMSEEVLDNMEALTSRLAESLALLEEAAERVAEKVGYPTGGSGLLNDAMIKLSQPVRYADLPLNERPLRTYVKTTMVRMGKDHLRREARMRGHLIEAYHEKLNQQMTPDEEAQHKEELRAAEEIWDQLSEKVKIIFWMRFVEGMRVEAIMEKTHLSRAGVYKALNRAIDEIDGMMKRMMV